MDDELKKRRDEVVRRNTSLIPFRGTAPTPENPNPQLPHHVWEKIQRLGAYAVGELEHILIDRRFRNLPLKDKLAVIQLAMGEAYNQGANVSKHLHLHQRPNEPANTEPTEQGNALTRIAQASKRRLPEFRNRRLPDDDSDGVTIDHDTLDPVPSKNSTGERD